MRSSSRSPGRQRTLEQIETQLSLLLLLVQHNIDKILQRAR
jgi:hypothetical protein